MNKTQKATVIAYRKQLHRMEMICSLLKRRTKVSMAEILRKFDETEYDAIYLGCSTKTVHRAVKTLIDDYNAPIKYNRQESVYELTDPSWNFLVPSLLGEEQSQAIAVGCKIAHDMLPPKLAERVTDAVDLILENNQYKAGEDDLSKSIKVISTTRISEDILEAVFDAWEEHKIITISYTDNNGKRTTRDIEPHAIIFYNMKWFIRGFCHLRNEVRTFRLEGILSVSETDKTFKPDTEIAESINADTFFHYDTISNIKIQLTEEGRQFANSSPLHSQQRFNKKDSLFELYVPSSSLEIVVPWILNQQGNAKPLEPAILVNEVRKSIRKLADVCQAYDEEEIRKKAVVKPTKN